MREPSALRIAIEEQIRTAAVGRAEYTAGANADGRTATVYDDRAFGVRIPVESCHRYVARFGCANADRVAAGIEEL
jgi:hypothetical protein